MIAKKKTNTKQSHPPLPEDDYHTKRDGMFVGSFKKNILITTKILF